MRYKLLPSSFFIKNRETLSARLKFGSLLIIHGNGLVISNRDANYPFQQDSDFFYLTGIDQPNCALILFPNHPIKENREILFTKKNDEKTLIWEGEHLSNEKISFLSGIKHIEDIKDIHQFIQNLFRQAEYVYLKGGEDDKMTPVQSFNSYYEKQYRNRYPLKKYESLKPHLHNLRRIKAPAEIDLIQNAIGITKAGFDKAIKALRPGVMEYVIESNFISEFISRGSKGFAFDPIIASGSDTCILHYIKNDKICKDDELVLMDIGAEYARYNADITRVFPINRRFTKRQKEVYQAVLNVMSLSIQEISTNLTLKDFNKIVATIMEDELLRLNLISSKDISRQNKEQPAYKKYFMHSGSHYLGLDVHDVGDTRQKLLPGVVITLEPGIYIREENLGIRLENDILITDKGYNNLSSNIPILIEEVENWINDPD